MKWLRGAEPMESYNPDIAPDPVAWLALGERERLDLVESAHEQDFDDLPNPALHCAMHVVIETQVAMGDELPVAGHLSRLLSEGLERHDAIHAIASVLAEHMFNMMKKPSKSSRDPNESYYSALARLSARKWRSS